MFGIALRKSGTVDFYFEGSRVNETPSSVVAEDIDISYDTCYVKIKTDKPSKKNKDIMR